MRHTFAARAAAALAVALAAAPLAVAQEHGRDPLSPDLVNSAVTVVVFLALLGVLYTFAWGPIRAGLQAREDAQFKALDEARSAREEAAAMRAQVQAELAKANDQVRALLEEARKDADALRAKEREAGVQDAQAERERAKREIAAARDAALDDIRNRAVELAALMSAKTIARQIGPDDHRRLLDESLAELTRVTAPSA